MPPATSPEVMALLRDFPSLQGQLRGNPSAPSMAYNCFAWTLGDVHAACEPGGESRRRVSQPHWYWPSWAADDVTLGNVLTIYRRFGYVTTLDGTHEPGVEKVAIYLDDQDEVQHVALQLPDGWWTSKLGTLIDVEHATLSALDAFDYGQARVFVARRLDAKPRRPMKSPRRS